MHRTFEDNAQCSRCMALYSLDFHPERVAWNHNKDLADDWDNWSYERARFALEQTSWPRPSFLAKCILGLENEIPTVSTTLDEAIARGELGTINKMLASHTFFIFGDRQRFQDLSVRRYLMLHLAPKWLSVLSCFLPLNMAQLAIEYLGWLDFEVFFRAPSLSLWERLLCVCAEKKSLFCSKIFSRQK